MSQYPDRIDFTQLADGKVIVLKLRRDETDPAAPRDIPLPAGHSIKEAGFDLEGAPEWCEVNGYAVRRWGRANGIQAGARALRGGKLWVIRTKGQILRKRRQNPCAVNLDFAYDC